MEHSVQVWETTGQVKRSLDVKVLFFSKDMAKVEQLVLSLRIRWPDLKPLVASKATLGPQVIEQEEPDLVMLCEDLADMDVFSITSEIRKFSDIPVIVMSDDEDEMQGIKALDVGADDYVAAVRGLSDFRRCPPSGKSPFPNEFAGGMCLSHEASPVGSTRSHRASSTESGYSRDSATATNR